MTLQRNAGAVRRFAKAMKFGAWLQTIPNKFTPAPFRLVQIGAAYWQSRALFVAARLDVATVLGPESLSATELAGRVGANGDALGRLMRMLAAMGIFEETGPRQFRNNRLSRRLRSGDPQSVRAMILMHNSEAMSRPWFEQLEAGVRSGTPPFRLCHGEELFDYLDHHADFDRLFSEATDSVEALAGDGFATDLDWSRFDRIIDVGGSRGAKALAILKQYPRLSALIVDRPQVVEEAQRYWANHSTDGVERLRFQAGDLLDAIPAATGPKDIYLLSAVLHDFDDGTCVRALHKLRKAIGSSGARAAVLDMVVPETSADIAIASVVMQMFVGCRGRERTLTEWRAVIQGTGMALEEVVRLRSRDSILVLRSDWISFYAANRASSPRHALPRGVASSVCQSVASECERDSLPRSVTDEIGTSFREGRGCAHRAIDRRG